MTYFVEKISDSLTPLTRYGLLLIIFILALMGLFSLSDITTEKIKETEREAGQLALINSIQNTEEWSEYLKISEIRKKDYLSQSWKGATPGKIAAELQQFLYSLMAEHRTQNTEVETKAEIDTLPSSIQIMPFSLRSNLENPASLIDILSRFLAHPHTIHITDLSIRVSLRGNSTLAMSGYIPIRLQPAEADSNAP